MLRNATLKHEVFQEAFKCLLGIDRVTETKGKWSCLFLPLRGAAQGRFWGKRETGEQEL